MLKEVRIMSMPEGRRTLHYGLVSGLCVVVSLGLLDSCMVCSFCKNLPSCRGVICVLNIKIGFIHTSVFQRDRSPRISLRHFLTFVP